MQLFGDIQFLVSSFFPQLLSSGMISANPFSSNGSSGLMHENGGKNTLIRIGKMDGGRQPAVA